MPGGSLVVVGIGMTFLSHMTTEVRGHIEQAHRVFVVVTDPAMAQWILDANANAEPLQMYRERDVGKDTADEWRRQIDDAIETVLEPVREGARVLVVLDGHPGVAVPPIHSLVKAARAEGLSARLLPGLSAEDCLFADLGVDPARDGCQSFEATDFLIRRRSFSTTSALVLRQIGLIGEFMMMRRRNDRGLRVLIEVLESAYGRDHEVVVYEAAPYPAAVPSIQRVPLRDLHSSRVGDHSTLYVPPLTEAPVDRDMLDRLGIGKARVRG